MSRHQSFRKEAYEDFEVLLDGSKTFGWNPRLSLDLLITTHPRQLCVELVAYNAEFGVEAPRIYMSTMLLAAKINTDYSVEFKEKLAAKKEVIMRQKKTANVPELRKQVYNELMVVYIMKRLIVVEGVDLTKELRVQLSPLPDEEEDVICGKPEHLNTVNVTYAKKARWV
jgi:hypothetical protein